MLRLQLLGRMEADDDGIRVAMPASERARALVGWLAWHPGQHDRGEVAAQLWPEATPDRARANLRTALWAVHQAWGESARHLVTTRTTVGLDESVSVDARGAADGTEGELMAGFEDEWLDEARQEHRASVVRRLAERATGAEADGDVTEAVRLSQQVCRLAPYDEGAHRDLLRRLLLAGDRASAVVASREFSERLHEDLGVRPSPPTRALHAEAHADGSTPARPRLFGRAEEAKALAGAWRSASLGRGRVVVVSGEPGIGKTSLVGDLAGRVEARGARTSGAVGTDVAGQTPFAAWLELCHGLVATARAVPEAATWPVELNRLSGDLGARLGHPGAPPPGTAPELERLRVFESVLALVEWSCADRPTLLVLDDAHRADRASLRLTGHVGRRLPRLPLLLVLVRRPGVPTPELDAMLADLAGRGVEVTSLALGPIDDGAVSALATSLQQLDDEALSRVVAAAEGNPLLAVESARAVAAGEEGPPANLRLAVRASLGRLPPRAVDLVRALAAAGRPLTPAEVGRLVPAGLDEAEDPAAAEGLVVRRAGRLGFRHDLLRDAVYADLPNAARMHDRLASAVDPPRHADVAHHLELAGREQEAAQELALAAQDARAVGALDAAAEFLARATRLDPDDGRLWLELEEVSAWTGQVAEMEHAWETALALLPADELAAAWCRRGRQHRSVACHPTASRRAYLAARDLLTPGSEPALRVECLVGLAWGDAVAGDGREFEPLLREAEALVVEVPDALLASDIAEVRMLGLVRGEHFERAAQVAREVAARVTTGQLPDRAFSILANGACACLCAGDLDGALLMADQAVAATRSAPSIHHASLTARAHVLARLGRHDEAADTVREMTEIAERLGLASLLARTAHDAGLVALEAGRLDEAATLLADALAQQAPVSRPTARLCQAEALALAGHADAAADALRRAVLEPVSPADQPWSLVPRITFVQALVARARGDADEAARRLDEADRAWRRVSGSMGAATADGYFATLVDLGRPPVVGLVDPGRELDRIEQLRRTLPSPLPTSMPR